MEGREVQKEEEEEEVVRSDSAHTQEK